MHILTKIREKLLQYPIVAAILLMLFYVIFLVAPVAIIFLIIRPDTHMMRAFLYVTISSCFMFLLWFIVVPYGFHLPKGKLQTFKEYIEVLHLNKFRPAMFNIGLGVCCAMVVLISSLLTTILFADYIFDINRNLPPNSWAVLIAIVPGFWEEVAFRGVLLALFLRRYSEKTAIFLDALFFSIMHLTNLIGREITDLTLVYVGSQLVYTFFAGLFFAYMLVKTSSLIPCIITHYMVDAFIGIFTYATSADPYLFAILDAILGPGALPAIINILLIKKLSKHYELSKINYQK